MEPSGGSMNKLKIFLGEFEVVSTRLGITIELGKGVHTTIHLDPSLHSVKPGDKLPLYTEVPDAITITTSEQ